jgi:predicted RNA-binding Zn ribbon-like protein
MPADSKQARPFKYVGGSHCLDFVNTVDWTESGQAHEGERLLEYRDLVRWALGAGVLSTRDARSIASHAKQHPESAGQALAAALKLRLVLKRLLTRLATGKRAPASGLADFNRQLSRAASRLEVTNDPGGFDWSWSGTADDLTAVLWPVTWSAANLLTSADIALLRMCSGDGCGWLFLDRSRNRKRRWCEMEVCGNRAKARRHYARQRRTRP